jgi:Glycosyl hydrolase catalytic core.
MDLTYDGYAWRRAKAIQSAHDILHAQISRNSLLWHQVESVQGVRDWSRTDAVVAELASAGIEPLFVVYGSPAWANGTLEGTPDSYLHVPTEATAFDTWLAGYASFAKEAATRYRGKVQKWEIGNEENQHYFWKPTPNPDQYARFYTTIRDAILSVDPDAQIAMGGLAGLLFCGPGDYTGLDFLKAINARGIYPENVAVHPYSSKNQAPTDHVAWQGNFDDVQAIHQYLTSLGRPTSIWITEWGWQVGAVTEQQQAEYLRSSLEIIASQYTYVTIATVFVDYDRPSYSQGLFTADFTPRPAAYAFGNFMAGLN